MVQKINKWKAIQAAKRKEAAEAEAGKARHWPGTRRQQSEGPQEPRRVGMIAHHSGSGMALVALMVALTSRVSQQEHDTREV